MHAVWIKCLLYSVIYSFFMNSRVSEKPWSTLIYSLIKNCACCVQTKPRRAERFPRIVTDNSALEAIENLNSGLFDTELHVTYLKISRQKIHIAQFSQLHINNSIMNLENQHHKHEPTLVSVPNPPPHFLFVSCMTLRSHWTLWE